MIFKYRHLILIIFLLVMIGAGIWAFSDANPAKDYCESQGGTYSEISYGGLLNDSLKEICILGPGTVYDAWEFYRGR